MMRRKRTILPRDSRPRLVSPITLQNKQQQNNMSTITSHEDLAAKNWAASCQWVTKFPLARGSDLPRFASFTTYGCDIPKPEVAPVVAARDLVEEQRKRLARERRMLDKAHVTGLLLASVNMAGLVTSRKRKIAEIENELTECEKELDSELARHSSQNEQIQDVFSHVSRMRGAEPSPAVSSFLLRQGNGWNKRPW